MLTNVLCAASIVLSNLETRMHFEGCLGRRYTLLIQSFVFELLLLLTSTLDLPHQAPRTRHCFLALTRRGESVQNEGILTHY